MWSTFTGAFVVFSVIQSTSMSETVQSSPEPVEIRTSSMSAEIQSTSQSRKIQSSSVAKEDDNNPPYIPEDEPEPEPEPDPEDDGKSTMKHLPETPDNFSESDMEPRNTTVASGNITLDIDSKIDKMNITLTSTQKDFPDVIVPEAEEIPEDSKPSGVTTRKPRPPGRKRVGLLDDSWGTWVTDTIKRFSIIISVILILLAALLAYIYYVRSRKKVEKKRQLAYEEIRRRRRIPLKVDNADEKNKALPIYLFDTEAKGIEGETDSRPPSGQRVVEIRAHGTDFANYRK